MAELLSYSFMRNALIAGVLVSLTCGIIGTLVVLKRMVFISGGVAHTAYGGVGLAFYLGVNPILGAVAFSLVASFLMGYVQRQTRQRQDTLIVVMWAIGMAIGIIFADMTPGYKADLGEYCTMGASLMQPCRGYEEGLRVVKYFQRGGRE